MPVMGFANHDRDSMSVLSIDTCFGRESYLEDTYALLVQMVSWGPGRLADAGVEGGGQDTLYELASRDGAEVGWWVSGCLIFRIYFLNGFPSRRPSSLGGQTRKSHPERSHRPIVAFPVSTPPHCSTPPRLKARRRAAIESTGSRGCKGFHRLRRRQGCHDVGDHQWSSVAPGRGGLCDRVAEGIGLPRRIDTGA